MRLLPSAFFEQSQFSPARPPLAARLKEQGGTGRQRAVKRLVVDGKRNTPPIDQMDGDSLATVLSSAIKADKTVLASARVSRAFRDALCGIGAKQQLLGMGVVHGIGHLPPIQPVLSVPETELVDGCAPPCAPAPASSARLTSRVRVCAVVRAQLAARGCAIERRHLHAAGSRPRPTARR